MRHLLLALGLITCITFAACGGDSGGGGGGPAADSPVGSYAVDKTQFAELVEASIKKDMGLTEIPEMMKGRLADMVEKTVVNLDVKDDGTWAVTGMSGGGPIDESGTWTIAGDKLTMVTTKKDGKDVKESKVGTYKGGVIMVKPDDDAPGEMRLVRK